MRRLIVVAIWMLILIWLVAWMNWSTDQGELPSEAIWAVFSLTAWWIVGYTSKAGNPRA